MRYLRRFLIYIGGMALLSMGIILNSKTGLGVSPIVSIAYCVAELRGLRFADMTMAVYILCFFVEMAVKGRRARWIDVLQLPFCWLMTRFMALFSEKLPAVEAVPAKAAVLLLAVFLTGAGVALMLSMRLVPNPADGLVQAVSDRSGKSVGFCKNTFDVLCVCITLALGISVRGQIIGVGIGTVAAVVLTGRAVALTMRLLGRMPEHVVAAAPISLFREIST